MAAPDHWGLTVDTHEIPNYLRNLKRWVCWAAVHVDGKVTKVPRQVRDPSRGASVNNPRHWAAFNDACGSLEHGLVSGIGFVLTGIKDDGGDVIAIDLDHCIEDGAIAGWAKDIVDALDTYWELSPSGKGLRAFLRGELPGKSFLNRTAGVEIYDGDSSRYVTVTGRRLAMSEEDVCTVPAQRLADIYARFAPAHVVEDSDVPDAPPRATLDDDMLERMRASIGSRWREYLDTGKSSDHSRTLLGLCVALYGAGWEDADVYALLLSTPHIVEVGERHWPGKSDDYLWRKCAVPARAIRQRDVSIEFEDVTGEGEAGGSSTGESTQETSGREVPPASEAHERSAVQGESTPPAKRVKPRGLGTRVMPDEWVGSAPPRTWLVEGWLAPGHVTLLYGSGGTGKSLLAQQLQTAMALGLPWLGMPVERGRSLGLYCEDDSDELWRRQEALTPAFHDVSEVLEQAAVHVRMGLDNALFAFTSTGALDHETDTWRKLVQECVDWRPRLLVLDTVSDFFAGNESDRHSVTFFLGKLNKLASKLDMAVLLLAHPSRAGAEDGTSGSTAWNNRARARWVMTRDDETGLRVLENRKSNYSDVGARIRMAWQAGAFVPDTDLSVQEFMRTQEQSADALFIDLARAHLRVGGTLAASPQSPDYAPRALMLVAQGEGRTASQPALEESMQRLLHRGWLHIEEVGRRRVLRLVEPAEGFDDA